MIGRSARRERSTTNCRADLPIAGSSHSSLTPCPKCAAPMLVAPGECFYCRAMAAEAKLARLSVWGDDEWMLKLAQLLPHNNPASKLVPLGFQGDLPPAGRGLVLNVRPQIPFRPEILTVAPECAGLGTLTDFVIGIRSQMVGVTPLPLTVFSPALWQNVKTMHTLLGRMQMDACDVAQDISLRFDITAWPPEPLVEVAMEAVGKQPVTKMRAVLWGAAGPEVRSTLR